MKYKKGCKLPIYKKELYIERMRNDTYLEFLYLTSLEDDVSLNNFIEEYLKYNINDDSIYKNLTSLDKFVIMLYIRMISLGNDLKINAELTSLNYNINSIIDNINNKFNETDLIKSYKTDLITINIGLPKNLIINDIDDIYQSIINYIKIEEEEIYPSSLSKKEFDEIMNFIPASLTEDILNHLTKISKFSEKNYIISPMESSNFNGVNLNLIDKTLLYFIKSIFSDKIVNFYELQFVLFNKLHMDYEWFRNSTVQECKYYINFYNADMKRQEEASKSSSSSMPSMPRMPSMPSFKR